MGYWRFKVLGRAECISVKKNTALSVPGLLKILNMDEAISGTKKVVIAISEVKYIWFCMEELEEDEVNLLSIADRNTPLYIVTVNLMFVL